MAVLPEHGRLEETSLPGLLLDLHRARFDGAMTLSRERVGKRFLFREGLPVFAESNLASESLGVQLMDAGTIRRPDYNRVVAQIEREQCKEGKALLDLGLLDPKGLFLALKEQVRIRIVECFGWPHGEFWVDASSPPPPDAQPFRTDIFALLQEGIETHWSADRVIADLGLNMDRYVQPGDGFQHIVTRLNTDEALRSFSEALDGSRTLFKAIQLASTPRALAAAWVFDAGRALRYFEHPASSASGDVEREVEVVTREDRALPVQDRRGGDARQTTKLDGRRVATLRREIVEKHARLHDLNHYELIGVERDADADDIKRAYHQAAKTYHPDALARSGLAQEARTQARQVFAEIGKAHAVLSDPRRRDEYDQSVDHGAVDIDSDRLVNAENLFRKGEVLLRQGNFRGALEFLRPAAELWPEEAEYQSNLGWVLYKKLPSEPESARTHLEHALRLDGDDGVTLFRLGVVLRALGEEERAATLLRRAQQMGTSAG